VVAAQPPLSSVEGGHTTTLCFFPIIAPMLFNFFNFLLLKFFDLFFKVIS